MPVVSFISCQVVKAKPSIFGQFSAETAYANLHIISILFFFGQRDTGSTAPVKKSQMATSGRVSHFGKGPGKLT
jgi:hypothetical protein